jgi:hypothetical protein
MLLTQQQLVPGVQQMTLVHGLDSLDMVLLQQY